MKDVWLPLFIALTEMEATATEVYICGMLTVHIMCNMTKHVYYIYLIFCRHQLHSKWFDYAPDNTITHGKISIMSVKATDNKHGKYIILSELFIQNLPQTISINEKAFLGKVYLKIYTLQFIRLIFWYFFYRTCQNRPCQTSPFFVNYTETTKFSRSISKLCPSSSLLTCHFTPNGRKRHSKTQNSSTYLKFAAIHVSHVRQLFTSTTESMVLLQKILTSLSLFS